MRRWTPCPKRTRRPAPLHLRNYRIRRYLGDDLCVSLESFAASDPARIRELYAFLERLFAAVRTGTRVEQLATVQQLLTERTTDEWVTCAQTLGKATYAENPSPLLARAIHDVRGGGLTPLLGQLQLLEMTGDPLAIDVLFFLTRDHLKIMRNALLGLDDPKREEDLLPKIHGTDFIVEKWRGSTLHSGNRELHLAVECTGNVAISECCVEFGALDRILYNLINNASRHAASDALQLAIFPVPDLEGGNLRFVLTNTVAPAAAEHLRSLDLRTLFHAGVSTTGSGYGLSVAAEFVANAFGLTSAEKAVDEQYLGARLDGEEFRAWFHWPVVAD